MDVIFITIGIFIISVGIATIVHTCYKIYKHYKNEILI